MANTRKLPRSRAYVEKTVTFYSFDAQQILFGFGRLVAAMYSLGIALRAYAPDEKVTALTETLYEELLTPLEAEIADDLAKIQAECKKAKNAPEISYSNPIQKTLRIFYPQALRVLQIAQNLDTLVCLLNNLWFAGTIKDQQYFALKEKYRNTLLDVARRIKRLASEKLAAAKGGRAPEAEPAAAIISLATGQ